MPGSSNSVHDDDNVAKLMPNVAKLIRAESNSLVCSVILTFSPHFRLIISPYVKILMILRTFKCIQESNGSTSMSLYGISGKEKIETQNAKPSRQRRVEAVFRDVANKFLRRGIAGKRSVGACKPSSFDTLSANYRCIILAITLRATLIPFNCWFQLSEKATLSFDSQLLETS